MYRKSTASERWIHMTMGHGKENQLGSQFINSAVKYKRGF
jgi:hypothetical protein